MNHCKLEYYSGAVQFCHLTCPVVNKASGKFWNSENIKKQI